MEEKEKKIDLFEQAKIHKKIGDFLEFVEDIIVLILVIFIFIITIVAISDMAISLFKKGSKVYTLIAKFIYIFILIEIFRLTIIYLKERRIDTSLMVKTTLIAVLREIIIKAPSYKLPEYIGVSVLASTLALMYYIPKYIFVSESKFELRKSNKRPQKRLRKLITLKKKD